ncbi:MAG: tetratricopeptide repeat protein [Chloroflexi bacterium]|nr:tetratricopeptide repeat protein [Chloroflexota bacterium]MBP8058559.1 tetratricopeptide repeat protein [Chloroflexota bacterium]
MTRFLTSLLLLVACALIVGRLWLSGQGNRAFVTLNHQRQLFPPVLAAGVGDRVLTQLATVVNTRPRSSAQRLLAIMQRAQGLTPSAPLSVAECLWWGAQKEKLGDWPAAAFFYRWATDQQPGLADGYYFLGRVYGAQNQWLDAQAAYEHAAAAPKSQTIGHSDVQMALGHLYYTAWGDITSARTYYEQALQLDAFSDQTMAAAAHYQLAELLLWQYQDKAGALPHYQATLTLTPEDHWAYLRLGYLRYWEQGDVAAATAAIHTALSYWPDEKYRQWPYFYLGEIYQDAGLTAEAIAAYEQVLALDPMHQRAQEALADLRSR